MRCSIKGLSEILYYWIRLNKSWILTLDFDHLLVSIFFQQEQAKQKEGKIFILKCRLLERVFLAF